LCPPEEERDLAAEEMGALRALEATAYLVILAKAAPKRLAHLL
jgi:hypothetical protein